MGMLEDAINKVGREYQTGDRNEAELALGTTAAAGRKVGDMAATVLDYMVPDALGIGETAAEAYDYLADTTAGQYLFGQKENFKEAYPRTARGIGEALDTTGLLGVAGLRKGLMGDPRNKGQVLTEGDVIVEGFYNPKQVEFAPKVEDFIANRQQQYKQNQATGQPSSALTRFLGTGEGKYVDMARFAKGFGEWGTRGVKRGIKSVFSPEARALYAEYGVNQVDLEAVNKWKASQDKLSRLKESGASANAVREATRAEKEARGIAQAQLQATANIRQQANNIGASKVDEIDMSIKAATDPQVLKTLGGKSYFQPNKSDDWYHSIVSPAMPEFDRGDFSAADSDVIQRHLYMAQKPSDDAKFIVKRTSTYETGKHWEDLFDRNTTLDPIANAFVQLQRDTGRLEFNDNAELMKYLTDKQKDANGKKRYTIKFDDPNSPENGNGIWISTSKVGSAKVEGGINTLYRVDKDGALIGVMSDKHDFLEKIVGLGQLLSNRLPTDVIAVTKPLRYDIFSSRKALFNKRNIDTPEIVRETGRKWDKTDPKAKPKAEFEDEVTQRLNRISALQASPEEIAKQRRQLAVAPASMGLMATAAPEENL